MSRLLRTLFDVAVCAMVNGSPCLAACEKPSYKIVLDVGHTEEAPGARSARGSPEYLFNLNLATEVYNELNEKGYKSADLLITKGRGIETLRSRSAYANSNNADLFKSIHHDSVQPLYLKQWLVDSKQEYYSDEFRGYSIFVADNNQRSQESIKLASMLSDELMSRGMGFTTHHTMNIDGERRSLIDEKRGIYRFNELAVLRGNKAVSILLEAGVIVNREEEIALASPERRKLIANAMVTAISRFCEGQ